MAAAFSTVCVLSLAMLEGVHSSVTWGLADKDQSCTAYCNEKNMACTPGHWPVDAFQLLRVTIAVDHTQCANVRLSTDAAAPAINGEDCLYNLGVGGTSAPSCAAKDANAQRLCPCSTTGLHWVLSEVGQSCTYACSARGGVCGDEGSVWPTTKEAMNNVMSYVGRTCKPDTQGSTGGTNGFNPSIGKDDTCYWGSETPNQAPFCAAADWTDSQQQRLCPCWDVQQ